MAGQCDRYTWDGGWIQTKITWLIQVTNLPEDGLDKIDISWKGTYWRISGFPWLDIFSGRGLSNLSWPTAAFVVEDNKCWEARDRLSPIFDQIHSWDLDRLPARTKDVDSSIPLVQILNRLVDNKDPPRMDVITKSSKRLIRSIDNVEPSPNS